MARLYGKTAQRAFLKAFAACANITKAAKAANIDKGAHYDWLRADPEYPARFAASQEQASQFLEDEATRRASEGVLQAEWYQGKAVGTKRVYSDGLMMFLLRGLKPEKFRQNGAIEISGPAGGPIAISLAEVLRERRARREQTDKQ